MKKLLRPLALALALGILAGGALAASGDGPVSLRYLTQIFFPQAVQEGEGTADQMLQESYDAASAALEQMAGGGGSEDSSLLYSADLRLREWYDGQLIGLTTGSGVLMGQGAASVTHNGAVVDVTEGTEVPSGSALAANHRYLVGEDTAAVFTIQSGWAQVGVQGSYTLSGGIEDPTPFADVKRSDWYYEAVGYVYENDLFSGMSEHTFGPGEPMTRAMLVTVLYQLAGAPQDELAAAGAQLTDVADGAWYASYVRWAVDHGIASGTGNGAFSPDGQVTREQVVVMLYSFAGGYLGLNTDLGADLSAFSDAGQVSSWAVEAMAWAVDRGVVSGSADAGGLSLNPGRSANRAEVAAMLRSFAESL